MLAAVLADAYGTLQYSCFFLSFVTAYSEAVHGQRRYVSGNKGVCLGTGHTTQFSQQVSSLPVIVLCNPRRGIPQLVRLQSLF